MNIEELESRRTDLSTFLVHLIKKQDGQNPFDTLLKIVQDNKLIAGAPFGPAVAELTSRGFSTDSQRAVCFTETPLEHVHLMTSSLTERRQCQFTDFGVVITKEQGLDRAANPIWYTDINPGKSFLSKHIEKIIDEALLSNNELHPVFSLTPFFEQFGKGINTMTGQSYRKDFRWEREWRIAGDCALPMRYIVFCPEDFRYKFYRTMQDFWKAQPMPDYHPDIQMLDINWSLERMISHLANLK
jgi:hypothetical protein